MPTIQCIKNAGPYRFFFWSKDCEEPKHVHVERDNCVAKFWLLSAKLVENEGFATVELRRIAKMVIQNRHCIEETWNEHCKKTIPRA